MAASLVENGAIDRKMFQDSTQEYLVVFAKVEPLLPALREKFNNPKMSAHLESLAMSLPQARQQIDAIGARIKGLNRRPETRPDVIGKSRFGPRRDGKRCGATAA